MRHSIQHGIAVAIVAAAATFSSSALVDFEAVQETALR